MELLCFLGQPIKSFSWYELPWELFLYTRLQFSTHAFWFISLPSLYNYDVNCQISRFINNMNIRHDDKFLFLSLNLNFFLKNDWTKWVSLDNGTEVSKNEKPLFKWHFCCCCGHGILNSLKCSRGRHCFMPVYGLYTYMLLWRVGFPRSLVWDQHAKKAISDSLGLVDFAIGLVMFVLNLPNGQVLFWGKFKLQKDCNQSR